MIFALGGAALVALLVPDSAQAARIRIRSRTLTEAFAVYVPGSLTEYRTRRRLVQRIDLGVYDLLPPKEISEFRRDPADGQIRFSSSLRLRHDFGTFNGGFAEGAGGLVFQNEDRQFDLLFAQLEGDRLGGLFDFRLGRQFENSGLDWFVFDGLWTRVRTPLHLGIEVFGGVQVFGASVLGYPNFELSGERVVESAPRRAPVVGAALSVVDLPWLDARLGYRRSSSKLAPEALPHDPELSEALAAADDWFGGSVDQEIASLTTAMQLFDGRLSPYLALRYNFAQLRIDDLSIGLDWAPVREHFLRIQYLRAYPAFDLGSVFAVFRVGRFEDLRMSWQVRLSSRWRLGLRGRLSLSEGAVDADENELETDVTGGGGGFRSTFLSRNLSLWTDAFVHSAEGSLRYGARFQYRHLFFDDRLAFDLSGYGAGLRRNPEVLASWMPEQGFEFSVQGGIDLRLWRGIHADLVVEEMWSDALRHSFRIMAVLAADWTFRVGSR